MALKGFPKDVLIEILNELAIKELATTKDRWECGTIVQSDTSLFRIGLKTRLSNLNKCWQKYNEYSDLLNGSSEELNVNPKGYECSIRILRKMITDFTRATRSYQKEIYSKEHNIYNSHSIIEFPLDKRPELNALYDDFSVTLLFFDDISTLGCNKGALLESIGNDAQRLKDFIDTFVSDEDLKGKLLNARNGSERKAIWIEQFGPDRVDYFESLETTQDKIDYVRENVEFDHCILGGTLNPNWAIGVYGELEKSLSAFSSSASQQALPSEYCDFTTLTLADTLKIKNQDLMQIIQSKIDIDRENLEVVDEKNIGGDDYRLVRIDPKMLQNSDKRNEYLIRFECPSTGRPYHIDIDENMLGSSKYYERGNTKTYIDAWWHITHGGMDPKKAEYVIRT